MTYLVQAHSVLAAACAVGDTGSTCEPFAARAAPRADESRSVTTFASAATTTRMTTGHEHLGQVGDDALDQIAHGIRSEHAEGN